MRYLVLMNGKPTWLRKDGLMFFARPRYPARSFGSYEEARSAMRRSQRKEAAKGWGIRSYHIQSVWP